MNERDYVAWILLLAVGLSAVLLLMQVSTPPTTHVTFLSEDTESTKPNIVFVLADDLAWNSMGYSGFDLIFATPFMTTLAERGIIMSNYYAQEMCTPGRSALMTGRYPLSTGGQFYDVSTRNRWGLNLSEVLLPEILSDNDYISYIVGKWNLGHRSPTYLPTARGFDYFLGYLGGQIYYWSKKVCRHLLFSFLVAILVKVPDDEQFVDLLYSDTSCYSPYNGTDLHTYSTFLFRDKAVQIIEEHDFSSPMFLYLPFQAVHDPFAVSACVCIVVS